jgi:hypothetical protein
MTWENTQALGSDAAMLVTWVFLGSLGIIAVAFIMVAL